MFSQLHVFQLGWEFDNYTLKDEQKNIISKFSLVFSYLKTMLCISLRESSCENKMNEWSSNMSLKIVTQLCKVHLPTKHKTIPLLFVLSTFM